MTRDELLARMASRELTAWMALFAVQAEEAKHEHDTLESGDGNVIITGLDDEDDEPDEDEDGLGQ
jgi:hypothetical protein